ncbi:hypothetical protein [Roseivivax sp. CAU 1761]
MPTKSAQLLSLTAETLHALDTAEAEILTLTDGDETGETRVRGNQARKVRRLLLQARRAQARSLALLIGEASGKA